MAAGRDAPAPPLLGCPGGRGRSWQRPIATSTRNSTRTVALPPPRPQPLPQPRGATSPARGAPRAGPSPYSRAGGRATAAGRAAGSRSWPVQASRASPSPAFPPSPVPVCPVHLRASQQGPAPSVPGPAPERLAAAMAGDGDGGCPGAEAEGEVAVACEALRLLQIEPLAVGPGAGRAGGPAPCSETSRLASQIRRLYGANRRAKKPFWLCLTEFVVGSLIYEECFRMNDGFSNYLMDTTQESYLDLFPLDAIVYLTPDSENVLEDIDPSKVYVLGGLVDESIHKKLTLQRAQEQSLQTARLPIREYMVKTANTKNYHSETLAINQVFDVLSTYYETRSWPAALKAGVSSGKGYVLPDAVK
uniref:tRNA methyltransferase 10 homolog B n=1 Tax=Calidris pygmaea TaxID=425635 RepID=A0A8C3JDV4_9CHAR